ncbi:hypothetical protein GCM10010168_49150 [Actinoplanes ianthinogenes]|uniref:Acyltransferase 3 domain-containing protein n=1 Tax=Actinoplanes ianthinogenes TaxID=122358 RepID=A0ABM7M2X5_9ACTN|nr:acyltransferase [Actinoplanes ianthinogenes]BCJ45967.1 hypothetical protein Aiant_66240 [Actinoplanes ianthinogenes]GGR25442.1 hypothetical protein GCM10010168_49150 [Actinoplanes ianthinogenes]
MGAGVNLPSLTGLRWVAAFLVFGFHLQLAGIFRPGLLDNAVTWLFAPGFVGVSFFFVLSGFVLMWSSSRERTGEFWWRRFARVYPLHLATLVLCYPLMSRMGTFDSAPGVLTNLVLMQSWSPDTAYYQSANPVSWTLSCEAFFYLVFPLLVPAVARLRARGLTIVAAGAWLVTVLGPFAGRLVAGDAAIRWFFHWTPPGRLPEFVCGVALAGLVRLGLPPPGRWLWPVAVVVVLDSYLAVTVVDEPWNQAACTMPGFALLLVAAAGTDVRGGWTPWRNRVLRRLGELSFAFYLVHLAAIEAMHEAVPTGAGGLAPGPATAFTAGALALALAAAWLLNVLVERPARRWLLRLRPPW